MFSFSVRNFKEQLAQPLGKAEIQFLVKTFQYACIFFLSFGFFTFLGGAIVISMAQSLNWVPIILCSLVGFLLYFPLNYYSMKYRNDPMAASSSFVVSVFTWLWFTFFFLFMGAAGALGQAAGAGADMAWFAKVTGFIFGTTLVIYAIPATIAFQIQKKSTILNLNKFLNFCGIAYIVLFIVLLLLSFGTGTINGALPGIMFLLVSIMLFVSPIITLSRMRSVVPYINHNDEIERKRWEQYFAFEISFQLLQLALHIARMVAMLVNSRSSSRLQ